MATSSQRRETPAERRAWAEQLLAACEHTIGRLAGMDDAHHLALSRDMHDFRNRLRGELGLSPAG